MPLKNFLSIVLGIIVIIGSLVFALISESIWSLLGVPGFIFGAFLIVRGADFDVSSNGDSSQDPRSPRGPIF